MTMKELFQPHWLNLEIDRDKQRLAELEARATSPGGPNMSGMPGGGGAGSSVESDAIAIIELKEQIRGKLARAMAERDRITAYIDGVDDAQLRLIMHLRFVDGLSWAQVGASVGAGYTGDACRMACKRYLEKSEQNEQNEQFNVKY